jgi:hypothetical protein
MQLTTLGSGAEEVVEVGSPKVLVVHVREQANPEPEREFRHDATWSRLVLHLLDLLDRLPSRTEVSPYRLLTAFRSETSRH